MPRRLEDRIWDSRGLRAAWLAAASLLLAANLLVTHRGDRAGTVRQAAAPAVAPESFDVGIEIPPHSPDVITLGEADALALALLDDPCLDPSSEGDCT